MILNSGRPMKRCFTIFIIFGISLAAVHCQRESEQEKIRKIVAEVQTAAEAKDVKAIAGYLSKNYQDRQGNSFQTIKGLLLGYFLRYPRISVYITELRISAEDESARAEFQTVLTSGEKTGSLADAIPNALGIYNFDVALKKESGDWKIASAKWTQAEF